MGKESNHLDEVEVLGLEDDTYVVYNQERSKVMDELHNFTAVALARATGISICEIKRLRNGKAKPHQRYARLIWEAIEKLSIIDKKPA